MKVIKKITEAAALGSNCSTTASKAVLEYYGYHFSEDMIFGLGAGLGFIYQYYADSDEYFLSGKNESIELNLAHALGGTLLTGSFDDGERGWQCVKQFIDEGTPVILDLSISHLPYFMPYMGEVAGIGLGLHNAVLIGYDDAAGEVLLLDHRWNEPQRVSYENLRLARNKREGNVSARNGYKVYALCPSCYAAPPDISFAIRLNINRMKNPFAYKMGLAGIRTFHNEIKLIFEKGLQEQKREAILTYSYLMEKLGTGGGNFRRMYGRFLNEAAELERRDEYRKIGKIYFRLAKKWKDLSAVLNRLADMPQFLAEFDEIMTEIERDEAEGMERLEKVVSGNCEILS